MKLLMFYYHPAFPNVIRLQVSNTEALTTVNSDSNYIYVIASTLPFVHQGLFDERQHQSQTLLLELQHQNPFTVLLMEN